MLVSFPHMGTMHIVLKALFSRLGCEVLLPPPTSKKTLKLGVRHSPEAVCLPFKTMLGNFMEALENGADTLVTCGGVGPCRLGYYACVQQDILRKLGYRFDMVVIEPFLLDSYRNLRKLAPHKSWLEIYRAFQYTAAKMNALDTIAKEVNRIRPRAMQPSTADTLECCSIQAIDEAETIEDINRILAAALQQLGEIPLKPGFTPLRVGLVGEIFVLSEPFVNQDIEKRLGYMGVEVDKTMYLSDYVKAHLLKEAKYQRKFEILASLAKPYIGHYVGGHGLKSIAYTIDKARTGFDGMVQVYPFTCMPEVIAKNILPEVSTREDIPVLMLAFDEQSGEAGVLTRLEAFVDLLHYRRLKQVT